MPTWISNFSWYVKQLSNLSQSWLEIPKYKTKKLSNRFASNVESVTKLKGQIFRCMWTPYHHIIVSELKSFQSKGRYWDQCLSCFVGEPAFHAQILGKGQWNV